MPSDDYVGRPRVLVRILLDDADRQMLAAGHELWLEMDGGELPWQLHITPADGPVPA